MWWVGRFGWCGRSHGSNRPIGANISPAMVIPAIIVAFLGRLHPRVFCWWPINGNAVYGCEMVQIHMNLPRAITGVFQDVAIFLLICDY